MKIPYRFTRNAEFRTMRVDGFFGGPSTNGFDFSLAGYCDMIATPETIVYDETGNEVERTGPGGVERELQVRLVVPIVGLMQLRDWIDRHLSRGPDGSIVINQPAAAPQQTTNEPASDNVIKANWGYPFKN